MTKSKRGGLGRGIGALIPSTPSGTTSPTDIFFGGGQRATAATESDAPPAGASSNGAASVAEPAADSGTADTGTADRGTADSGVAATAGSEVDTELLGDDADGLPESLAPVPGAHLRDIPVDRIRPNARQPRTVFDDEALAELTHSVGEFGVLQPIVVRQTGDDYELVMGERRLRAATAAGLITIPAVVRDTTDDVMLRDALLENIHRAQLNPLEEAAAYQQLLDDFGVTHEELAVRIGRSRSHLSNTVRLMNLPVPVQRRVAAGVLSAGHARALLALPDADQQDELASRIVAEGLSVRATEELVTMAVNGHGPSGPSRRRPVRRFTAPAAADLAEKLSDTFDTRVRVDIGQRKGKITVEFASIDDLERIVAIMAPGIGGNRRHPVGQSSDDEPAEDQPTEDQPSEDMAPNRP